MTTADNGGARIAYQPALDGVRALAVVVVLLFHAEVPGFSGGYLGVSVFFTLSGYLITSLLIVEHDRTGRISLAGFYARRIRRLLPVSSVCLVAVAVFAAVTDVFDGVADLRREIVGSGLQVLNWVLLAGGGSYRDLLQVDSGARSPLEHFWSLSIEEQFYWLWPPVMLLILGVAVTHRSRTIILAATSAVFAVLAPVIAAVWGPDAAYWATPARMAEILIGAVLALVLQHRHVRGRWTHLGTAALVVLAVCVVTFPAASGPAYHGWLPVVAVVSAALIAGLQTDGPLRWVLSTSPFVWIGMLSFGLYVYHWPVYVIIDADRLGVDGVALLVARLAITAALAVISYLIVEQPIRHAHGVKDRVVLATAGGLIGAVALIAVVIVPTPEDYWLIDEEAARAAAIIIDEDASVGLIGSMSDVTGDGASAADSALDAEVNETDVTTNGATEAEVIEVADVAVPVADAGADAAAEALPEVARPVRIVVAGDSTAEAFGAGLVGWAAERSALAQVQVLTAPGCGFLRGGERWLESWSPNPKGCEEWVDGALLDAVGELQPDVVVLMASSWDALDRRWTPGRVVTPFDPEFAVRLIEDLGAVTDAVLDAGAGAVAWVRSPVPDSRRRSEGLDPDRASRHDAVDAVYTELASSRSDSVKLVRLDTWVLESGFAGDRQFRPDGVHLSPAAAALVAEEFAGPLFVRLAIAAGS